MNSLIQYAKKLRQAADLLDDLAGVQRPTHRDTSETAQKIRQHVRNKRGLKKGFKYHGTHWTQLPKNRHRLKKMAKKMHDARKKLRLVAS